MPRKSLSYALNKWLSKLVLTSLAMQRRNWLEEHHLQVLEEPRDQLSRFDIREMDMDCRRCYRPRHSQQLSMCIRFTHVNVQTNSRACLWVIPSALYAHSVRKKEIEGHDSLPKKNNTRTTYRSVQIPSNLDNPVLRQGRDTRFAIKYEHIVVTQLLHPSTETCHDPRDPSQGLQYSWTAAWTTLLLLQLYLVWIFCRWFTRREEEIEGVEFLEGLEAYIVFDNWTLQGSLLQVSIAQL